VRAYRMAIASRSSQAASAPKVPSVFVDWSLSTTTGPRPSKSVARTLCLADLTHDTHVTRHKFDSTNNLADLLVSAPGAARYLSVYEEIAYGPASWLWDYLRRSGLPSPLSPLSFSFVHLRLLFFNVLLTVRVKIQG
jgi:NAD+ synthase (glutamine-hydrolysing)